MRINKTLRKKGIRNPSLSSGSNHGLMTQIQVPDQDRAALNIDKDVSQPNLNIAPHPNWVQA